MEDGGGFSVVLAIERVENVTRLLTSPAIDFTRTTGYVSLSLKEHACVFNIPGSSNVQL